MISASEKYPALFSTVRIGPMQLKHRAVMSAHGMGLGERGPGVSDRYRAYLIERARGGAAMVGIESSPVHSSSFSRGLVIRLDDDGCIPSLAQVAHDVHDAGGKVAITLWHGGHKDGALRGPYSVAPSPIPNMQGEIPKALTRREIADVVAAYGKAAARCRAAGLDCLEVQTATDYLLGSFLSPALNHRSDEYGGTREKRLRIVVEILTAVRAAAGDRIAVGVRCSTRHAIPGADVDYTLEESIAAMQALDQRGLVDYVSVMAGSAWSEGASIPSMHFPRVCIAADAAQFKNALRVPVIIAGRIRTAAEAEKVLTRGEADVIAMARTWIAEPHWANKIHSGHEGEVRPCMSCNQGCAGAVFRGLPGTCVLNPRAGRELEWPELRAPRRDSDLATSAAPRTLAVIGGGPAGMETARLAAQAGWSTALFEQSAELGGQWAMAARAPNRSELGAAISWWQRELQRLGVAVHLNTRVDATAVPRADKVVWAVGGIAAQSSVWRLRPFLRNGIPGSEMAVHGRDVMRGTQRAAGNVAVIDEEGGWASVSLIEHLLASSAVTGVTVYTPDANWASTTLATTFENATLRALYSNAGVRLNVVTSKIVQLIDNNTFLYLSNTERVGPFETIVLATGSLPAPYAEDALAVGDCVAPRGIWSATSDAQRCVRELSST